MAVYDGRASRAVAGKLLEDAVTTVAAWEADYLRPLEDLLARVEDASKDGLSNEDYPFGGLARERLTKELDAWKQRLEVAIASKSEELENSKATLAKVEAWGLAGERDLDLVKIIRDRGQSDPHLLDLLGDHAYKTMDDIPFDEVWTELLATAWKELPKSAAMELECVPETERFAFLMNFHPERFLQLDDDQAYKPGADTYDPELMLVEVL